MSSGSRGLLAGLLPEEWFGEFEGVRAGGRWVEGARVPGGAAGKRVGDEGEKGGATTFRRGVRKGGGGGRGMSR